MSAALESYLNRMVSIITMDGRNFVGTLKGFDQVKKIKKWGLEDIKVIQMIFLDNQHHFGGYT
jgi:small nuclear ribonucleoprotein (snRNP)-like protein